MNKLTKSILEQYEDNIKELDISNKNITGTIDLSRFKNLIKLNCSGNKITKINGSRLISNINYSNNSIKFISNYNLFDIQSILTNPINEIEYPFTQNISIFPDTLKKIKFSHSFNDNVDNLPNGLEIIVFGVNFNKSVNNLPNTIKEIYFGTDFNQSIDNLPCSLVLVVFGGHFNKSIDNLPTGLNQIKFEPEKYQLESEFNNNINYLPNRLEKLILPVNFNNQIINYPPNIKYLYLGKSFNQSLDNIPDSIEVLIFDSTYDKELKKFPSNLKHLTISNKMSYYSSLLKKIPNNLTSLYLPEPSLSLLNNELILNLKKIKLRKFYYEPITMNIIKNSKFEEIILGICDIKLPTLFDILPITVKKLKLLNSDRKNIRIKTNLIPNNLIFFQINGKKYDENKLKKIKKETFYVFN